MLQWFEQLSEFFTSIGSAIAFFFESLVNFIGLIPQWYVFFQSSVLFIPPVIQVFALTGIVLTILLMLLGRLNG